MVWLTKSKFLSVTGFGIVAVSGLIILILMAAGCTGKDKKGKDEVDGLSMIN